MTVFTRLSMSLCLALALLVPSMSFAQGADLEAEAADLEGDALGAELEERKPKEKAAQKDPDAKLLEEVNKAREEIQAKFNALQKGEERYAKVDEALGKIISKWIPLQDTYIEKHRSMLEAYQTEDVPAKQKKLAKNIVKIRKQFTKKIKKLSKKLKKVEKLHAKLSAKAAKEAPEPPADEEGGADE
ncbi:MAG: hypothetical protein ACE366_27645 [Bradymonadia bacterium]